MSSGVKRKVALVFTGAVSLGSFEAGVAYEIVRHIQEQKDPGMEVDVIVGTSAGALTGALTAMALVFGLDPAILEESWVSVRLEDLLKLNPGDKSILSSSKVEGLIESYINPERTQNPITSGTTNEINLAVVVTNLDGMKYHIHRAAKDQFSISAIGYEDALKFRIRPRFKEWKKLQTAVRASSAYPGAFEHKRIARENSEFTRTAKYNFQPGMTERYFNYSDGGIVNNQPLNKAIEIVNDLPYNNTDEGYERVFLVIDPAPPVDFPEADYKVFDVVSKALWTIPRNQTLYKDLLFLEKVNRRIQWKNSFVSTVADMWNASVLTEEKRQSLERLCEEVARFKGKKMLGIDSERYLRYETERIKHSYSKEIDRAKDDELFVKYCYLLEHVADLRNKHEVSVEMIRPQDADKELAGVIFGNFGGFLDSGFMKHDYNVGRTYARRWLKKENELNRLVTFEEKKLSPLVQYQVFQKMLDNSVPLLIEDIGPRLFMGNGALKPDIGMFSFISMISMSLVRYIVNKTVSVAKSMVLSKKPT